MYVLGDAGNDVNEYSLSLRLIFQQPVMLRKNQWLNIIHLECHLITMVPKCLSLDNQWRLNQRI